MRNILRNYFTSCHYQSIINLNQKLIRGIKIVKFDTPGYNRPGYKKNEYKNIFSQSRMCFNIRQSIRLYLPTFLTCMFRCEVFSLPNNIESFTYFFKIFFEIAVTTLCRHQLSILVCVQTSVIRLVNNRLFHGRTDYRSTTRI